MATKQIMHITLNFKDSDTPLSLSGDDAQRVVQAYQRNAWLTGEKGIEVTNDDGERQFIQFDCLCGYTLLANIQEEVPGRPCENIDCIEDYEG